MKSTERAVMYRHFYKMKRSPFVTLPSAGLFFQSKSHLQTYKFLLHCVDDGEPYILISGEYGAGKTLLYLKLITYLNKIKPFDFVCLPASNTTYTDILNKIHTHFNLPGSLKDMDEATLQTEIYDYFECKDSSTLHIIIDDLQDYNTSILNKLKALSNFNVRGAFPFRLICFAHHSLLDRLNADESLIPLSQRFKRQTLLKPLQLEEVKEYIYFRMIKAGGHGSPLFSKAAIELIAERSNGTPRLINNLCDQILIYTALNNITTIDDITIAQILSPRESPTPVKPALQEEILVQQGTPVSSNSHNLIDLSFQNTTTEQGTKLTSTSDSTNKSEHVPSTSSLFQGIFVKHPVVSLITAFLVFSLIAIIFITFLLSFFNNPISRPAPDHQNILASSPPDMGNNDIKTYSPVPPIAVKSLTTNRTTLDSVTNSPNEQPFSILVEQFFSLENARKRQTDIQILTNKPTHISHIPGNSDEIESWNIYLGNYYSKNEALQDIRSFNLTSSSVKLVPYTLLIGLYDSREEATSVQDNFAGNGYDSCVVGHSNGTYGVRSGVFTTLEEAEREKNTLLEEGIFTTLIRK